MRNPASYRRDVKMQKNPRWNGGKYTRHDGYVYLKIPSHPDADCRGYIAEHRVEAESMIGRRLSKSEDVHHINGVKSDNRHCNLEITSRAAHQSIHSAGKNNARYRHDIDNELIKKLRKQGKSYRQIADETGYPQTTIARRIRLWSL